MTTLKDSDIEIEIMQGRLLKNADMTRLAGATYELRLGYVYYDLTESDQPIPVAAGENILIKPGHRVVLITHEDIDLPDDMFGRVVSKGSLFSIGLSHVATYADPGFVGNLGIVTQNISDKYIMLPPLEPIAKIDFTRLSGSVQNPYRGQHGFRTQIWPIKHQLQKTYSEVKGDKRVQTEKEEAYRLLPTATAEIMRLLERRQRALDVGILLVVVFNAVMIFLVGNQIISNIQGLVGNLVASAICLFAGYYIKWKQ